ncbi:MAG: phosphatase PAP2 family protein [Chitinophagaceae bacterium]|nr:phosphatase PAP2 family protein [Chitinophagaceae bacterium]
MKKPILFIITGLTGVQSFAQNTGFDIRFIENISNHRTASGTRFYKAITNTSLYVDYSVPVITFAAGLASKDKAIQHKAIVMLEAQVANALITQGLKHIINRKRPAEKYPDFIAVVYEKTPSFPSGHTSGAFANATSLSLAFRKWYVVVPAYSWATLMGYSRMYLGVHYPSDVLAGAILGSGTAWLSYKVNKYWQQKKLQKKVTALY